MPDTGADWLRHADRERLGDAIGSAVAKSIPDAFVDAYRDGDPIAIAIADMAAHAARCNCYPDLSAGPDAANAALRR